MNHKLRFDNQVLLERIRRGSTHDVEVIYDTFRKSYLSWIRSIFPEVDQDTYIEAWQEANIAFYKQIISGRLVNLHCQVQVYLFQLAKRYMIKYHHQGKRTIQLDGLEEVDDQLQETMQHAWEDPLYEKRKILLHAMRGMTSVCKELLQAKFYEEKSITDIKLLMNYENEGTVSAALSRCLRQLKEYVHQKLATT